MKRDREMVLMRRERAKGVSQEVAAARSAMSVRTLRKYERSGKLPSELKGVRHWRTRIDPFALDWAWIEEQLQGDAALQAKTLFGELCERHPGRYQAGQLRTLQRHMNAWRHRYGPQREVMFEQTLRPGEYLQSDFTRMNSLAVTIAGEPFAHLLFHMVLPYSNVEAVHVCFSESFEALAEGMQKCLAAIGGAGKFHRTDNLSAAVRELKREREREPDDDEQREFTPRYRALLEHYGMRASRNHPGVSHQNGDVESAHRQFKRALDQALRLRGHRNFSDRAAYERYLDELARQRNLTRSARFEQERALLAPLPAEPPFVMRELSVRVNRFSLIRVLANVYSVPSRLIGAKVKVRVHAERLEVYHGTVHVLTLSRLIGRDRSRIDYRHVIWSLVRKPGAFMAYKYREEMFPSLIFRRAFDALERAVPAQAIPQYLRLLHLAASTAESAVAGALERLLEQGQVPSFDACRALLPSATPDLSTLPAPANIDLAHYDRLLVGGIHG